MNNLTKRKFLKAKPGFTLIELSIAIVLIGLSMTLTTGVLVSVVKTFAKQRAINEIDRNADRLIKFIEDKGRKSSDISLSGDNIIFTLSENGSSLNYSLNFRTENDICGNDNVTTARVIRNGADLNYLINHENGGVYISNLNYNLVKNNTAILSMSFDMVSCSDNTIVKGFQTVVNARGSY